MAMTYDAIIRKIVHRLEFLYELTDGDELDRPHRFIVIADTFDADREFVDVFLTAPH